MKTTLLMGLMSLSLLSVGCGKSIDSAVKKMGKDMSKQIGCGFSETGTAFGSQFASDYDVKLYRSTVEKVLADLSVVKFLEPNDFWAYLSDETRDLLNYELNLIQLNNMTQKTAVLNQATAYFFTAVKDSFKTGTDYKFKDKSDMLYTFALRGDKTVDTQLLNLKCGKYQQTDLASITTVDEILKVEDVREVYECRTETETFTLMDGNGVLFLKSKTRIARLAAREFEKDDARRTLNLSYESSDAQFKIKIKKKNKEIIKEWQGKKARIEMNSSFLTVDDHGVCDTLIRALED